MIAARSAKNTLGCLVGCAIGDLGAIFLFQSHFAPESIPQDLWTMVWIVAMSSGIITSVILETFILWKQLGPKEAFETAVGMSMISMLLMEVAMNVVDYGMMGEPAITLSFLPFTLGCRFSGRLALQFLAIEKAWEVLSLDEMKRDRSDFLSLPFGAFYF